MPELLPPNDVAAEQAVLAAVLMEDRATVGQLLERLQPSDFYLEAHRVIYDAIVLMYAHGRAIDLVTLAHHLRTTERLQEAGGAQKLATLMSEAPVAAHLHSYVDIVLDLAHKRALLQEGMRLVDAARNGSSTPEILATITASMEAITRRRAKGVVVPISLRAFQAAPPPKPEWLVDSLVLEASNGWIGAGAKVGKSYLALDLLLALALGEDWLGHFAIPGATHIVLIEEEDSAWRVYERVQRLLAARGIDEWPETFYLSVRRGYRIDDPGTFGPLARWLESTRPRLVVWDVFNKLHLQDERKPEQIMPVLWALDKLRNEIGVANLVAHHQRKPGAQGPDQASGGQKLRGPSEFWGWAENSLYLSPLKQKGHIIVEPESKDALLEPFKAHLEDRADGTRAWKYDGVVQAKEAAGMETRRRILATLTGGPRTVTEIVTALGNRIKERAVKGHLASMASDGVVDSMDSGGGGRGKAKLWMLCEEPNRGPEEPGADDVPF